ncbi:MAG TPA: hypothetical protein PLR37_04065 [Candidatus Accumulibacter phosphatis]|nr:hypothetical protein [Candidatus Accumulibacter phosphatis]
MPRLTLMQTNFTAGEMSPRLLGRVDITRYANGAKTIENGYPLVHGGVIRRPGTRFVTSTKFSTTKRSRLIPYIFNEDQSYIIEFGDLYIRVYKDGAQVLSAPSTPYEIATPYTEAMLDDLDYVQGADTMFIAHPGLPIYRLRRQDHDDWSLAPAPFTVTPFDEIGFRPATTLTLSSAAVGAGRTLTAGASTFLASDVGRDVWAGAGVAEITAYTSATEVTASISVAFSSTSIAADEWQVRGSPQESITPSAKDPVGGAVTLTAAALNTWRPSDVGKFVKVNRGLVEITGYTSALQVTGTILTALDSVVSSPADAWTLEASVWNSIDGYPRTVSLHEQRLIAAGSPGYPQTVWMSRIGESLSFESGTADDDAMSFTISSDQINPIAHMGQVRSLIALTYGGEFTLSGGSEKPITPTNIQVRNQSVYGCNAVRPIRIGNELFFVQRASRKLRAMSYKFETDAYGAPDLSVLAEHATASGIVAMAYQQEPESIIWMVRSDGVIATVTVDRDQDVVGWARQITDGVYESIATIPVSDGEEVWAIVRRTVGGSTVRYVERFDPAMATDCAITGTHATGTDTWAGLDHLEGKEVDVLADGIVMQRETVSGGVVTIARDALAVEIGLPYTTTIETLTPDVASGNGSAQGNSLRIAEVTLRFLDTTGCELNGQVIAFRSFGPAVLDAPAPLFTGDHRIEKLGWERGSAELVIQQRQPLPFHLLSVIKKFTVND